MRIEPSLAAARLREIDGWGTDDDLGRAVRLAEHMGDRTDIAAAEALDVLHPGGTTTTKTTTLRKVVDAVRDCAADVELTTAEGPGNGDRLVCFTADRVAESEARLVELGTVGERFVDRQSATVQRDGKPVVRVFLSYSADDAKAAAELWRMLGEHAAIDNKFHFEFWDFKHSLLPGDDWHELTTRAIEAGDLGIFAVSRHFLASTYIHQYELPNFVGRNAAIPVLLETLDLSKVDRKGLDGLQIFQPGQRAFDSVRGPKKNQWVQQLRNSIRDILERQAAPEGTRATARANRPAPAETEPGLRARTTDLDAAKPFLTHTFGHPGKLSRTPDLPPSTSGSRVNAVDHLVHWAGSGPTPLAAVLGEYGVGKTITCQAVMRELQRRRREGATKLPEPLYFDLRSLSGLRSRPVPTLTEILDECVQRGWSPGESGLPAAGELLARAATRPTLFIIDGLDEALVHLTAADGIIFTKELLGLRPPRAGHDPVAGRDTKVLLSCRTHYFRTVAEQYAQFTGQHRDAADADDFEALLLLPFTDDQIRHYLSRAVPDRDCGQVFDMLTSLHDLSDLTSRPVTLKLVAQQVTFIEQRRAQGLPVHAADIYLRVVTDWLERDRGKEQFRAQDKLTLMARLAAWMWQRNERTVDLTRIENWLHEQVQSDPALRRYHTVQADLLEEDLRTATFLVRQDSEDGTATEGFRFAHSSFQEFFVAQFLLNAIEENRPQDWAVFPSNETIDFLGQLLHGHPRRRELIATLGDWRTPYRAMTSELLLRYAIHATNAGRDSPTLAGIDLTGANLRGFRLRGDTTAYLNLSGARLTGADLSDATLDFVDLTGADLTSTCWHRAVLHRCVLAGSDCACADLSYAFVHDCDLTDMRLDAAEVAEVRHVGSGRVLPEPPTAGTTALSGVPGSPGSIYSVAWSPDGTRAVIGTTFNGRIIDTESGQDLHTLSDHADRVNAVAWSPDNTMIVTGGGDGTARIWNASTGAALISVTDGSPVISVSWSPDSRRIVTCSCAQVQICDADTGEVLLVLSDVHSDGMSSVAWSPGSNRIAGGSYEHDTLIWNADTGATLLTLTGHSGTVNSLAWSADGTRLITGSDDGTARIWDATTGRTLRTLTGHTDRVTTVAWAPDDSRVVTGCADGTVQISDADSGRELLTVTERIDIVSAVAWFGARLAISGGSHCRIVDAYTGRLLLVVPGTVTWASAVAWSPDDTRILVSGRGGSRICYSGTGETALFLDDDGKAAFTTAWSPDGTRIITSGFDSVARIWDAATGQMLAMLAGHTDWVTASAWSPDCTRVITGSKDTSVRVWDTATGETLSTLTGHTKRVTTAALSPSGSRAVTAGLDGTSLVWNTESGKALFTLADSTRAIVAAAWSPDGARFVTCSLTDIRIHDTESGRELRVFGRRRNTVNAVAWSPDGTRIATAGMNNKAQIWDATSGEHVVDLTGHTSWVNSVAWSSDSTRIVTGCEDGFARVWDSHGSLQYLSQTLPLDQSASWAPQENRLLWASPGAWRYLRAATFDDDGNLLGLQPYERYYAIQPPP